VSKAKWKPTKAQQKGYNFRYRKNKPQTYILYRARQSAKIRGLECTLTVDDIPPIPEFCPVFPWIRLQYRVGEGMNGRDESPSLDRIENDRGYVAGNVRIISDRANRLKSNATYGEIVALLTDFEGRKKE
jgi:hypothetical protein